MRAGVISRRTRRSSRPVRTDSPGCDGNISLAADPMNSKFVKQSLQKLLIAFALVALAPAQIRTQNPTNGTCPRPAVGSIVSEPQDLKSQNGVLRVNLAFRNFVDPNGQVRYCYVSEDGSQSPNLRLHRGDLLILSLKNELSLGGRSAAVSAHLHSASAACAGGGEMTASATNLHFHGLAIPPICHQDDVLTTSVLPADPAYEYRVRIPANQPPGLYWYHPHLHGFSEAQVLGGASGALIVEGIERANPEVAGLPERIFIIRDQDLLNPGAPPLKSDVNAPPVVLDPDGDARNTGSGTGKPAKDLSVNSVPVPYPDYEPAIIQMRPAERQLWRVLNASAISYLNLQLLRNGVPQGVGVVGLDGVPIKLNGSGGNGIVWQTHVGLPPGGRAEFIVTAPPDGIQETLLTRSVNTGAGGENDPVRPLAMIVASKDAHEPRSRLSASPEPLARPDLPWLGNVKPARTRKLYFSEVLQDPKDPNSPTKFYITVDGASPVPFNPNSTVPNIVVRQGDVEDWIIENRSQELHAFHIHQIHFMLTEWFGVPVNEPFLRDTINVPFWDGKTTKFPSVRLRMDFRNPEIAGIFPYHCHLLEHEDGGMMGLVRVEPSQESEIHPAPGLTGEVNASTPQ
jgi:FtsP/CotA-like multicopper oxidase with cupredoxin domain